MGVGGWENAGNFVDSVLFIPCGVWKRARPASGFGQIPYSTEQGIFIAEQGIYLGDQGIFRADQGKRFAPFG